MIALQSYAAGRGLALPAAFQQTQVSPADSVLVESPLPSGVAGIVRFLLNTVPPWIQVGGVVMAVLVSGVLLYALFWRRHGIATWVRSRAPAVRAALGAALVALILLFAGTGAATWNYTQHSNDFCTGCHVMNPAFQRFSATENKHADLSCHACHQQSIYASMRQLYLWVAERPEKIGLHSKVASRVCRNCHVTGDTATWQRIAATAGHRVHLESDSSVLTNVQCVTCHGVEVHRFRPVDQTCGQADCHKAKDTDIVLGKMAAQTVRHCTGCHAFTASVPTLATRDSARGTLVPGTPECLGCHEMQQVLTDFNPRLDPHGGKCGTCHEPHTQSTPAAAVNTCAMAGCHDNWRDDPFHSGDNHKRVGDQCLTCHSPHSAKVDASGCESCHLRVRSSSRLRPPLPFDTAQALRRTDSARVDRRSPTAAANGIDDAPRSVAAATSHDVRTWVDPRPALVRTVALTEVLRLDRGASSRRRVRSDVGRGRSANSGRRQSASVDSFPHARHAKVACIECHGTGERHGRLTFEPPRGCAICHHQDPRPERCATCHRPEAYGAERLMTVTVTVPGHQPSPRPVAFVHARHASRSCVECHTTPVTLAPAPAKAGCADCHVNHHEPGRNCSTCHRLADPALAHRPLDVAHQRCDACHSPAIVAELTPTRSLCSACHAAKARGHYDDKECSVCHFFAAPEVYRSRLTAPPRR